MSKHTAGPWTFFEVPGGMGVSAECADVAHCRGFDSKRSVDEERANAVLIAAAPDLLAALQRMVTWGQAQKTADGSGYYSLLQAREAISRAKGEPQ